MTPPPTRGRPAVPLPRMEGLDDVSAGGDDTVPVEVRAQAELERRRRTRERLTSSTHIWYPTASPNLTWTWPHLVRTLDHLDAVSRGDIDHLLLLMPPRHGKTESVTIRFPVFEMERTEGKARVIQAAYNTDLAEFFSGQSRALARARGIRMDPRKTSISDWATTAGGGIRAVGVGSGVTGRGGDLIMVDDPVKSREEAESPLYRERCWQWYTNDLYTRREPGGKIIVCLTHWHFDDIAGRILNGKRAKDWTVLKLPAEAEEDDPLGREVGAALCPERYPLPELERLHDTLGDYAYSALFQQRPVPRSGNKFPRDRVPILDSMPEESQIVMRVRAWDKAASTSRKSAYTCGLKMALTKRGQYIVEHVVRGRWEVYARDQRMRQTAEEDGTKVRIELEQEPGSGGKESRMLSVGSLAGYNVHFHAAVGEKSIRSDPFAAQWQGGNVALLRGDWNTAYLEEMETAPLGQYKDQHDASADAFAALLRQKRRLFNPMDFATLRW